MRLRKYGQQRKRRGRRRKRRRLIHQILPVLRRPLPSGRASL